MTGGTQCCTPDVEPEEEEDRDWEEDCLEWEYDWPAYGSGSGTCLQNVEIDI